LVENSEAKSTDVRVLHIENTYKTSKNLKLRLFAALNAERTNRLAHNSPMYNVIGEIMNY
jgi:hypothetical protein